MVTELATALQQALALHQQGRLRDAARRYHKVLRQQPNNVEALHLLGMACLQARDTVAGVELIREAIRLSPNIATMHVTLANGLRDLGYLQEALCSLDTAIMLAPDYSRAWYNRGNVLLELRRLAEAHESYDRAVSLDPKNAEAHNGRGNVLAALKRLDEAVASFDRAIALRPDFAGAFYNRGNAHLMARRFDEALASHDLAVAMAPDLADAHSGRGNALWELNQPEAALAAYNTAIALRPDFAEAYSNRSNPLRDLKRPPEALESCDRAIALQPDHAPAHHNRGTALMDLFRYGEALASYEQAIALDPEYSRAWFNRANALIALAGREKPSGAESLAANIEAAITSFDRSIALQSDYAPAYCNRANALMALLRTDEAAADFHKAMQLDPDYVDARWNNGLRLLLTGAYAEGWRSYEWRKRLKDPVANRDYARPLWSGEPDINGKTVFVYWEQGFGDTIQFCRYLRLLEARGARVVAEVQRVLIDLLRQISPTITFITPDKEPPAFDYHCPLMSLPHAFGTTAETIPAASPYLRSDERLRGKWGTLLNSRASRRYSEPRIGIAWSGNRSHQHDHLRSLDLKQCLPLLAEPVDWICLQKEISDHDAETFRQLDAVSFVGDDLEDFSDTAALIDHLDLVITVDTSVAHLAGAMGKPVWIMLPYSPDWRWLLDRNDSPWYPSARLFRQSRPGAWDSVIGAVKKALRQTIR